jgi:chaperonin GroES
MVGIKLNDNRILVEPINEEQTSPSGIILPAKKSKYLKGKIILFSDVIEEKIKQDLEIGDIIMFKNASGSIINIDGMEYRILTDQQILLKYLDETA